MKAVAAVSANYLNLKEAGATLQEVAVDVIETEKQNVLSRWYHSPMDIDIYLWTDQKKNLIKQQVILFGQVVEWNIVEGVRTGFLLEEGDEEEVSGEQKMKPMRVEKDDFEHKVQYDEKVVSASVIQAIELFQWIDVIEAEIREMVISNYKDSPTIDNLSPEVFLSKFGATKKETKLGFWSQLKKKMGIK